MECSTLADHSPNKLNTVARNGECGMWNLVHSLTIATSNGTLKLGIWNVERGMLYTS
jgi:hypothetical protein